jgi:hypothetical protein
MRAHDNKPGRAVGGPEANLIGCMPLYDLRIDGASVIAYPGGDGFEGTPRLVASDVPFKRVCPRRARRSRFENLEERNRNPQSARDGQCMLRDLLRQSGSVKTCDNMALSNFGADK